MIEDAAICDECGAVKRKAPAKGTDALGEFIVETVAKVVGISVKELKGRGRAPAHTIGRAAAIYIMYEHGDFTWKRAAEILGKRDHSTAMNLRRHFDAPYVQDAIALSLQSLRAAIDFKEWSHTA